jgi:hypothetical protein
VVGGSKKTLLDHPDWLAFDLDPSSGVFADAAKTGLLLHEILADMRAWTVSSSAIPTRSGGRKTAKVAIAADS